MIFERYERPSTIAECLQMQQHYADGGRLLAGGTDLIPRMRMHLLTVKAVIDLSRLNELCKIERQSEGLFIGAMTRLRDVQLMRCLKGSHDVLCSCAGHVSSIQVRNAATLGGNACNASPSADTVPGLFLLDAKAVIAGNDGERTLPITEFFEGFGKVALKQNELLKGFLIPKLPTYTGASYYKYSIRGDSDISIVGAGAALTIDKYGRISRARIALASVAPLTLRLPEVEATLKGNVCEAAVFEHAAELCSKLCKPISDQRASAEYRSEMVRVFSQKALVDAAVNAQQKNRNDYFAFG